MDKKILRGLALGLGLNLVLASNMVYAGPSFKNQGFKAGILSQESWENQGQDLLNKFTSQEMRRPGGHFVVGQLDKTGLETLVVYEQRDINREDDPGYLVSYRFENSRPVETSRLPMDYSNTVLEMKIAKGFSGENLLYVVSSEGAHGFGIRLFRLRENRLEEAIDRKNLVLSSQVKAPKIEDINGDGNFEFSISRQDPILYSPENPATIDLWYRFNGVNSGQLVRVDRDNLPEPGLKNYRLLLDQGKYGPAYAYLKTQGDKLSNSELDQAIRAYLLSQGQELEKENSQLSQLLNKYPIQISAEDLGLVNRASDFKKSQLYKDKPELRSHIMDLVDGGYYFQTREGEYNLALDYGRFLDFGSRLSPDLSSYLSLMDLETRESALAEESLAISMEAMAARIGDLERFRLEYPYSDLMGEISQLHNFYLRSYLFHSLNQWEEKLDPGLSKLYEKAAKDYDYLPLSNTLNLYLGQLKKQDFIVNDNFRSRMNQLLMEDSLAYGLEGQEDFLKVKGLDFKEVSRLGSETLANEKLEDFLKAYLDYKPGEDGKLAYYYNYIDLNNDGRDEVIVYLIGSLVSGSGGDRALILNENYQLISKINLARNPIIVSQTTSKGYRDLIVGYWGGGGPSGYGLLRFNGKSYETNPDQAPKAQGTIRGLALISNQLDINKALELR